MSCQQEWLIADITRTVMRGINNVQSLVSAAIAT